MEEAVLDFCKFILYLEECFILLSSGKEKSLQERSDFEDENDGICGMCAIR